MNLEDLTIEERIKLCDDAQKLLDDARLDFGEALYREFTLANNKLRLLYQGKIK